MIPPLRGEGEDREPAVLGEDRARQAPRFGTRHQRVLIKGAAERVVPAQAIGLVRPEDLEHAPVPEGDLQLDFIPRGDEGLGAGLWGKRTTHQALRHELGWPWPKYCATWHRLARRLGHAGACPIR